MKEKRFSQMTLSSLLSITIIIFSVHAFLPSLVAIVAAYTEPKYTQNMDDSINSHDSMMIRPIAYNNNNIFGNLAKQFEYTFDLDGKQIFPNDTIIILAI
jgi:hypothetical protein